MTHIARKCFFAYNEIAYSRERRKLMADKVAVVTGGAHVIDKAGHVDYLVNNSLPVMKKKLLAALLTAAMSLFAVIS